MKAAPNPLTIPRTVVILGVPFHDVTMGETLAHIDQMVAEKTPRYLATANLDFADQASKDVELQRILLEAHLVLCDGTPLLWAAKWLNASIRERVAGSDLMPELTAHCAKKGHRMFLLGATDKTLDMASKRMMADHPDLQIAGMYSPPFGPRLNFDHEDIIRRVNAAGTDVLIVCFGCPKQEKWIYMNLSRLQVPVSIGLGATLDFVAGNFTRAPVWMRKSGFEWLYRLMQEPRRLFNRYLFDLFFFVTGLARQKDPKHKPAFTLPAPAIDSFRDSEPALIIKWAGRCDAARVSTNNLAWPAQNALSSLILLDASEIEYLDSTGLGAFLRLYRECKAAGGDFYLLNPSDIVVTLLASLRLDRLIPSTNSISNIRVRSGSPHTVPDHETKDLLLSVEGDIVARRCPDLRKLIEDTWHNTPAARTLVLDLRQVSFIDSSGLGLLVMAHRLTAKREHGSLSLHAPNPNVLNVIKIARMEKLFGLEDHPR